MRTIFVIALASAFVLGACGSESVDPPAESARETSAPPTSAVPSTTPAPTTSPTTTVPAPSTPGSDDVALCNDGNFSNNADFLATCSGGDGIDEWLATFARCTDNSYVRLEDRRACPEGKEGFAALVADGSAEASLLETFDLAVVNSLRCSNVEGPIDGAAGDVEHTCFGPGGGAGVVIDTTSRVGTSVALDVAKDYLADPRYNQLASVFFAHESGNMALFDYEGRYWPVDGVDFDTFSVIDTNCLSPGVDDPALCGAPAGTMPDLTCQRLDLALDQLSAAGLPEPDFLDATGEGRNPLRYDNWVVITQSPVPFTAPSGTVTLAIAKTDDPGNPC